VLHEGEAKLDLLLPEASGALGAVTSLEAKSTSSHPKTYSQEPPAPVLREGIGLAANHLLFPPEYSPTTNIRFKFCSTSCSSFPLYSRQTLTDTTLAHLLEIIW